MSDAPQARAEVRDLLHRHGVHPSRRLGQHFLVDGNVVRKIVRIAGVGPGSRVLEIGAGTGTLTRALAATGASVRAYEVDASLRPVLAEALSGLTGVDVRFEDATRAELPVSLEGEEWQLVANLPYNVGTPLLLGLLTDAPQVTRHVVMVQDEVAARLTAGPGSKVYGIPSVVTALYSSARVAFRVPPHVFYPRPAVQSAVVELVRRPHVADAAPRAVELARAAFGQRRKMLRKALATEGSSIDRMLHAAGVEPTARAETVAPEAFLRMAEEEAHAG